MINARVMDANTPVPLPNVYRLKRRTILASDREPGGVTGIRQVDKLMQRNILIEWSRHEWTLRRPVDGRG